MWKFIYIDLIYWNRYAFWQDPHSFLLAGMNSKNKQLADLLSLPIQQKQKRRIEWTPNTIPKVPMGYKSRILDHFYGKYNTQECVRQHTTRLGWSNVSGIKVCLRYVWQNNSCYYYFAKIKSNIAISYLICLEFF